MALKIIGCIIVVSASTLAGFLKAHSLYRRRDFLKSFTVFLNSLATQIRYNSSDIFVLVRLSAGEELSDLFENSFKETNKPFSLCWKRMVDSVEKSYPLTQADRQVISDFGGGLGITDVDGQLNHIRLYKNLVSKQLEASEEDIAKKSKLYRTMGFFVGTAAALTLI